VWDVVGDEKNKGFWWRNMMGKGHLEVLGLDKRIILKWILYRL